jgi:uncharacterized HAD superfamily protein
VHIYVDFDDCLCETGRYFSGLVAEMYGKDIPYEDIRYFDLQKSFSLTEEQYERMMIRAHKPEALLSFSETAGASNTINSWLDTGHDVSVITGRPNSAYEPSRAWLDRHGLERAKLYCLNKYGRDSFLRNSDFSLELEDFYQMRFDYAVEDSPAAFRFFGRLPDLKVLVFDRPWNQQCAFPSEKYTRCFDWETIKGLVG